TLPSGGVSRSAIAALSCSYTARNSGIFPPNHAWTIRWWWPDCSAICRTVISSGVRVASRAIVASTIFRRPWSLDVLGRVDRGSEALTSSIVAVRSAPRIRARRRRRSLQSGARRRSRRGAPMSDDTNDFNAQVIAEFRDNGGKVGGPFEGAPMVLLHHT